MGQREPVEVVCEKRKATELRQQQKIPITNLPVNSNAQFCTYSPCVINWRLPVITGSC